MRYKSVERELELSAFSYIKTQKTILWSFISIFQYQGSNVELCHSPLKNVKSCHSPSRTSKERYSISKTWPTWQQWQTFDCWLAFHCGFSAPNCCFGKICTKILKHMNMMGSPRLIFHILVQSNELSRSRGLHHKNTLQFGISGDTKHLCHKEIISLTCRMFLFMIHVHSQSHA